MSIGDGSLNLPYEKVPAGPVSITEGQILASGVVVSAVVAEVVSGRSRPGVMFRFALGNGEFLPPVTMVCTEQELRALVPLVNSAVEGAIEAIKQ